MRVQLLFSQDFAVSRLKDYRPVLESFFQKHRMRIDATGNGFSFSYTKPEIKIKNYSMDLRTIPKDSLVILFNIPLEMERLNKIIDRGNMVYLVYHKSYELSVDKNIYLKEMSRNLFDELPGYEIRLNTNTYYKNNDNPPIRILLSNEQGILDSLAYIWGHIDGQDREVLREFRKFEKGEIKELDENTRFRK